LQDRIFDRLFEQAEIAKYSPEERREYEVSVKNYWDYNSTMKTAATNASNERAKKIAQNLKAMNVMTTGQIAEATGLTAEEIEGL
jgi:predicted KAP-like P-loop ATPase